MSTADGRSTLSSSDAQSSVDPLAKGMHPGDGDEMLDDGRALSQAVNGVLYTVSKEKQPGWKWCCFRLFFDALQLWLLLITPNFGYQGLINPSNKLWQVISLVNLTQFLSARGYTFFVVLLYIMFIGLLVAIGLCVWVGASFQNNRFDHVWPIVVLRIYSVAFFQVLDIACMTLFMVALDCQFYFTDQPARYYHQEFEDVYCLAMPHVIHMIVAIVSLIIFAGMAGLFTMAEMELNPLSKNPLAMAHTRVEVLAFALKFVMTSASSLVMNLKWLGPIQAACALMLLYLYLYWVPHLHAIVNDVRVGTASMTFYCAGMLLLLGFLPGIDSDDSAAVKAFQRSITYAMWAGLVPAFMLGAWASRCRQNWFLKTVVQRFREAPLDAKPQAVFRFTDVRQVEILGRCCRVWVEEDELDDSQVKLAESIMKNGMAQLPNSAFMIILYSSFLIDVQTSYQSGYSILQVAKKQDPSFFERFALFSREQQHAQKSSSNESGQATDLVSYVEFQRNYRLVLKVHKEALLAARAFWACLMHRKVKFDVMSACLQRIEHTVKQAERTYRNVLQRHANNMKVVRLYARFLEQVKHDPWAAAKWAAEAEKLEQLAEENKASNVFNDLEGMDPSLRQSLQGEAMSESHGIFVINAQGIVQATNQAACDLLGYQRTELVGRNVNQIIPPPFSEHHNNYIRAYLSTGKAKLLNKTYKFMAVHKERHLVRITLRVTKVSGIGEDTMFLGLLEPELSDPDVAYLYCLPNSKLLCVDALFSDWFAFSNDEVVGTHLSAYLINYKGVQEQMKAFRAKDAASAASHVPKLKALGTQPSSTLQCAERGMSITGNAAASAAVLNMPPSAAPDMQIPGIQVAHKYADPIDIDCTISTSSMGTHHFLLLALKRRQAAQAQHEMLVSDTKGRVLHVTQGLAVKLGTTPRLLLGNDNKNALSLLLVQPFAQMHYVLASSSPPNFPPPYSCRSGLTCLMASMSPQGPDTTLFRMHLKRKQLGVNQNVWHVATLEQRSMAQAVQERCLQVLLDVRGYVIDIMSDNQAMPFGMRRQNLMGAHISRLVDILSSQQNKPAANLNNIVMQRLASMNVKGSSGDAAAQSLAEEVGYVTPADESTAATTLLEMATKTLSAPGISWRCGVLPRPAGEQTKPTVAALLGQMQAKPGIMSVAFALEEDLVPVTPAPSYAPKPSPAILDSFQVPGDSSLSNAEGFDLIPVFHQDAVHMTQDSDVPVHPHRPVSHEARSRRRSALSTLDELEDIRYKVKLWRTDFCTSILEVDGSGRVIANNAEDKLQALYPQQGASLGVHACWHARPQGVLHLLIAGLILGTCDNKLHGEDVTALLPVGVRGVRGLLEDANKKKTPLKRQAQGDEKPPGPVHMLHTKHCGDASGIVVTVQAVPKLGLTSNLFLVLHAHKPACGRPDFIEWVKSGGLRVEDEPEAHALPLDGKPGGGKARRNSALVLGPDGALQPAPPQGGPGAQPANMQRLGSGLRFALDKPPTLPARGAAAPPANEVDALLEEHLAFDATPPERSSSFDHAQAVATAAQNPRLGRWVAASSQAAVMPEEVEQEDAAEEEAQALDGDKDEGEEERQAEALAEVERAEASINNDGTDYRRGKRYKKLVQVLSSVVMQQRIQTFKVHTTCVVIALMLAHFGLFALMYVLLNGQTAGVTDLNNAGLAQRFAGEVGLVTGQLQQLYEPEVYNPPVMLKGMTNASDIPALQAWYRFNLDGLKEKQIEFYLGPGAKGRPLPTTGGIRDIWEKPILQETMFDAIPKNESIDFNATLVVTVQDSSLWDVAKRILAAGNQMYSNADWRLANYGDISGWSYYQYLLENIPNVYCTNLYITMDSMVHFVLEGATKVNQWQTVVLAVEGGVMCALAFSYVWYLAIRVGEQRFGVYSVFLAVPTGLVRGLATRKLELDEDEDDEEEAGAAEPAGRDAAAPTHADSGGATKAELAAAAAAAPAAAPAQSAHNMSGPGSVLLVPGSGAHPASLPRSGSRWERVSQWLRPSGSSKGAGGNSSRGRQLVLSYRQPLLLTWPFLLWGVSLIITYTIGVLQLGNVSGPIATFNMVNFVASRTHLFFFELQAAVQEGNITRMVANRQRLADRLSDLKLDYTAMMYGGQALPNETTPHFTLATLGLTYAGGQAGSILFTNTDCMCEDTDNCKEDPGSLYYSDTHNGLASLMNTFIKNSETVVRMTGLDPWLNGPEFAWFWNVRFDVLGGLSTLSSYYQTFVLQVYHNAISIHIAALVITCLIMLSYLMFVLRPFIAKVTNETKRIAELLSQLPPDVDVESWLLKAMPTKKEADVGPPASAALVTAASLPATASNKHTAGPTPGLRKSNSFDNSDVD